ncbi:hypothetical protein FPV67DRAFT_1443488 [Lyophyllum atratum]|nr:hypothetical protein FPV67DRAFT_1443488 [Lyophyllum atratum]
MSASKADGTGRSVRGYETVTEPGEAIEFDDKTRSKNGGEVLDSGESGKRSSRRQIEGEKQSRWHEENLGRRADAGAQKKPTGGRRQRTQARRPTMTSIIGGHSLGRREG